ncbi:methyltransferase domain-containing protein [Oceaniovalibus sp. ACAM 378]|uniref:methyltransferase domain-containing protein n=1 Tax=Oceaniovalibus sp. ACAM 378 TaxID=2599923 RepID=UPI0011DAA74D|nr:methyltransferase domain-containing protein [Oceaniovalibus sp. ACAM 378]TYB86405.1 SAM-dependent methyltransferase [Oceaniovalibus sp. ACAM 378]
MSTPPRLTDRTALTLHRQRATRDPAAFLHDEAIAQVQERLEEVNRTFTSPAIITGHPQLWANAIPGARIVADNETTDLLPLAHDLVIHAMALHWADDPVGQLVQARRALRPDGLLIAVLFGGQTLNELRAALAEAEIAVRGGLSPRIAPMGEIRDLGALLQRAGFALPVADSTPLRVTYATPLHLMRDLRAMGETNALLARDRRPAPRALFTQAATLYAAGFPAEDGRIRATFDLVFLTGWAPDDSQPKALRPGSAKGRLAEALGVTETGLHDDVTSHRD